MKELVDSFYRDVQIKICSIQKTQKREIRTMIKELKLMRLGEKSSKQRKKCLEESVCSNDTVSTWTKEKQSDRLREIVQLSSSMKNVQEQSHQLKVPNSMGLLGACNSQCSSSLGSTQHPLISSDCKSSAVDWKMEETESNAQCMRSQRLQQRQQQHLNSQMREVKKCRNQYRTNTVLITKKSLRVNSHSLRALEFVLDATFFKNI